MSRESASCDPKLLWVVNRESWVSESWLLSHKHVTHESWVCESNCPRCVPLVREVIQMLCMSSDVVRLINVSLYLLGGSGFMVRLDLWGSNTSWWPSEVVPTVEDLMKFEERIAIQFCSLGGAVIRRASLEQCVFYWYRSWYRGMMPHDDALLRPKSVTPWHDTVNSG